MFRPMHVRHPGYPDFNSPPAPSICAHCGDEHHSSERVCTACEAAWSAAQATVWPLCLGGR